MAEEEALKIGKLIIIFMVLAKRLIMVRKEVSCKRSFWLREKCKYKYENVSFSIVVRGNGKSNPRLRLILMM